jgi:hypothetical protein
LVDPVHLEWVDEPEIEEFIPEPENEPYETFLEHE